MIRRSDGAGKGPASYPPAVPALPTVLELTPIEVMLQREAVLARERLERDDRARAAAGRTKLRVVTAFTIFGDPDFPDGRVLTRGDEIEVSDFDLPKYLGRARPFAVNPGEPA